MLFHQIPHLQLDKEYQTFISLNNDNIKSLILKIIPNF